MLKQVCKATLLVFAANILTYCSYLLLMISGIIKYYELAEDYLENLPIYLFFFIFPIIVTVFINLYFKAEKVYLLTSIIEVFLLGILSMVFNIDLLNMNCSGIFAILQYIQYSFFKNTAGANILLKSVSPFLSAFFYYCSIVLGNKLSGRTNNR